MIPKLRLHLKVDNPNYLKLPKRSLPATLTELAYYYKGIDYSTQAYHSDVTICNKRIKSYKLTFLAIAVSFYMVEPVPLVRSTQSAVKAMSTTGYAYAKGNIIESTQLILIPSFSRSLYFKDRSII